MRHQVAGENGEADAARAQPSPRPPARLTDLVDWVPFKAELAALLAAAVLVQLVFPYRQDWPAHVVGGGAVVLICGGFFPRRIGPWFEPAALGCVVALSILTELTIFSPFDVMDVSFTLVGALIVAAGGGGDLLSCSRRQRRTAITCSVVMIVGALVYHYGLPAWPG
ncbi:MAG TPA: hypothetical protein VGM93_07845 [Acidimicrobiales bacterium]